MPEEEEWEADKFELEEEEWEVGKSELEEPAFAADQQEAHLDRRLILEKKEAVRRTTSTSAGSQGSAVFLERRCFLDP